MNCQKYFLIRPDKSYTDQPEIINVAQNLPLQAIYKGESWKIPSRPLLSVKPSPYTFFAEYMELPMPLISEKTRDILKEFEDSFICKEIILYDRENQRNALYSIPFFKRIDCVSEQSICNPNRSVIRELVLKKELIQGIPFFYLENMDHLFLVMRLDVIERLLYAGVSGFTLSPVRWEE